MPKTAIPSPFPRAGIFQFSSVHVDLSCAEPGAKIYYSIDDPNPADGGRIYNRSDGLIRLTGERGSDVTHTISAFAVADGLEPSDVVSYSYRFITAGYGEYSHQLIKEPTSESAGIIRIEDFDLDKMYLIIGSERAVLVDAGWDYEGDLPALCRSLIGRDIPIDLVVAHGHPDHVAQVSNFKNAGCRVYMPHTDIETVLSFCPTFSTEGLLDIKTGDTIDLGNCTLRAYTLPGHTPGGIVLLDEATGNLFSSDELGSNRRYVPDSAWLQLSSFSVESCLRCLNVFLAETDGKLNRIFTGHNDDVLDANSYLECLRCALENGVKNGNAGLSPSLRSAADSFGSGSMLCKGDWRIDPIWVAANVKFIYDADANAQPPKYADGYIPNLKTQLNN